MINDEERREVAARLRACAQDVNGMRDFAMYLSNWVGVEGVADDEGNQFSVAADRRIAERTLEKLADLIDPPTTTYICDKCGGEWPSDIMFERCPYCGTVIDDD